MAVPVRAAPAATLFRSCFSVSFSLTTVKCHLRLITHRCSTVCLCVNLLIVGPNHFLQGGLLCDSLMLLKLLKCRREAFRVTCSLSWLYLGRHPSVVMPQSTPFKFHRSSSSSRIAPPHHVSRVALSSWVVTRIVSRAIPSALPSWSIARLIGSVNVF